MDSNSQQVSKGNILIVDDSLEHLKAIAATLSHYGYTVWSLTQGSMVLAAAKLALPDLILLDIKMPEVDGYEVCQQLKADEVTFHIPIIFLSASHDVFDKVKAFKTGGVDYITKPFQAEEVLARVENQLIIQRLNKQLKQQNQQLQKEIAERYKAEAAAAAASQAKTNFIANMSHELRTPLNAILGLTQLISRDFDLSEDVQENLRIIYRSGEHLLALINDILELSKIEAGVIWLEESSFDFYYLLDSIEEMFQVKAVQEKNKLIFNIAPNTPQYIKTDKKKLRCCLINLIDNAIKFTKNGTVILRVSIEDEKINSSYLLFEVEDTGCGIARDEIEKLFDAFVQAEVGKKSTEGTGLGLTITRKFVQMMGGNITVESSLGQGSIFKFKIKITVVDASEAIAKQQQRVIGLQPGQPVYRILVVDDTIETTKSLMKLLERTGFVVRTAENSQEAIAVWESWQPHLIWINTHIPVMEAAIKEIRKRERQGDREMERWGDGGNVSPHHPNPTGSRPEGVYTPSLHTIIIALTTTISIERQREILTAGCNDLVSKPFSEEVILAKMAEYLEVSYIYEQLPIISNSASKRYADSFLLQELALMPLDWVRDLYQASNEVNEELIYELLEDIPKNQASLLAGLKSLINDFRFDIIVHLTAQIINK
ncbi:response regulator [Fischerella sp. PCC 9605]|uniref:response regulator n=1 Tax=Fischerella sp. PCC 9605 TaxID=1173024 RepID=UPI00047B5E53|nr:response regulator [Fischerella sp. PCC 9605]